jgi:Fe-S-cluster containining protein
MDASLEDFRRLTIASARAGLFVLRTEGRTPQALETLVDSTHEQSGVMNERLQAKYDPMRRHLPVCAEGCAWCCYFSVLVAPAEALRIARHLRATLDERALAEVRARVAELAAKTRDVSQEERVKMQLPCAMLDVASGACTVHEVRPGMCRAYNSCDVKACVTAFETRDLHAPIPGNKGQQDGITSVWIGMLAASALAGLDATVVELSLALDLALSEPDVEARWLAGEQVFESARDKRSGEGATRATAATQAAMRTMRQLHPDEVPAAAKPTTSTMSRNEKKRAKKRR